MRKQSKMIGSIGTILVVLLSVVWLSLPADVGAKAKVVPIEGMSYQVNASLEDNLKSLVGKKVSVTLDSGKTLTGLVKEVGNHLIHLEKLDGKEFFDALIRIENIVALEARFRNLQQ